MERHKELQMLDWQVEATQVSIYCEIIKNILIKHRNLSVIKILAISFVIKKYEYLNITCYSAKNKSDLVLKFLSQATGRYDEFCLQISFVFQAIDLLIHNGACELKENEVVCKLPADREIENYGMFTTSAIEASRNYTDRQFLKEVLNIV